MTSKISFLIRPRSTMKPNGKQSHPGLSSNYKPPRLHRYHCFKQSAAFLLFTVIIFSLSDILPAGRRALMPLSLKSDYLPLQLPTLRERQSRAVQKPTLYFILEKGEINCAYRFNVVCKFWFFVRCVMFGDYKDIFIVSQSDRAIDRVINEVRPKDIILFSWRTVEGSNHSKLPNAAEILLKKGKSSNKSSSLSSVRIGVFHIGNEKNRKDFPWYSRVDFVLRNYWIPKPPPHVLYIPLAPQYSDSCRPNFLFSNGTANQHDGFVFERSKKNCSCGVMTIRKASNRGNLWMFSGSLRGSRAQLVKELRNSITLKTEGTIQIARVFGGDGIVGSRNPVENPKTEYLNLISDSAFVFAPCGNVMETHRIYEAASLGAIPVIENCEPHQSRFFPLEQFIIGNGTSGMIAFVEKYILKSKEIDKLQRDLMNWWQNYLNELQRNVSLTLEMIIPKEQRFSI